MKPKLTFLTTNHDTHGYTFKTYELEHFNVSPFSNEITVSTYDIGNGHFEVSVHFRLLQFYIGKPNSEKRYSAHKYHFTLNLPTISSSTCQEELTNYVINELLQYSNTCKIPKLHYLGYTTPTSSSYNTTITKYIQRKYSYTPLITVYGAPQKKQFYTLNKPTDCICFLDRYLPLNFIMPKADHNIYMEIQCPKITIATTMELFKLNLSTKTQAS